MVITFHEFSEFLRTVTLYYESNNFVWVVWKLWCQICFHLIVVVIPEKTKKTKKLAVTVVNVATILIRALRYFNIKKKITVKGFLIVGTEMIFEIEQLITKRYELNNRALTCPL